VQQGAGKDQEGYGYDTLFAYDAMAFHFCIMNHFFITRPCLMK
jgi:hypothetical protein